MASSGRTLLPIRMALILREIWYTAGGKRAFVPVRRARPLEPPVLSLVPDRPQNEDMSIVASVLDSSSPLPFFLIGVLMIGCAMLLRRFASNVEESTYTDAAKRLPVKKTGNNVIVFPKTTHRALDGVPTGSAKRIVA